MLDALSPGDCIRTTCQNRYDICNLNNNISAKGCISAGDGYHGTSLGNGKNYSDISKAYGGTDLMSNGDKYHGGKLVSFMSSSGERQRDRTNADKCR